MKDFIKQIFYFGGAYFFNKDLVTENWHYREALTAERLRTHSLDQQIQQMHQSIASMHDSVEMLLGAVIQEDEPEIEEDEESCLKTTEDS